MRNRNKLTRLEQNIDIKHFHLNTQSILFIAYLDHMRISQHIFNYLSLNAVINVKSFSLFNDNLIIIIIIIFLSKYSSTENSITFCYILQ